MQNSSKGAGGLIKVTEEMQSAFFSGFCMNSFLAELCEQNGRNHSPIYSNYIMIENSDRFLKRLHDEKFRELKLEDSLEMALEFTWYRKIVDLQNMLWVIADVVKFDAMQYHDMVRDVMLRPISDQAIMAFFVGLSWIFGKNKKNRKERLQNYFQLCMKELDLKISREEMLEIWFYFMTDVTMEEWRAIAHDMMNTRYLITGKTRDGRKLTTED